VGGFRAFRDGGGVRAVLCPVCALVVGERDRDGAVLVKRGGQVVAIDPRVIPCRRRDCAGVVELERTVARLVPASGANGL
jgi:hypothetical protein